MPPGLISISNNVASTIVAEQKEKERKQLNLIVHNLAESIESDALARKEKDTEEVTKLFTDFVGVEAVVTKANRIGKKSSKPH